MRNTLFAASPDGRKIIRHKPRVGESLDEARGYFRMRAAAWAKAAGYPTVLTWEALSHERGAPAPQYGVTEYDVVDAHHFANLGREPRPRRANPPRKGAAASGGYLTGIGDKFVERWMSTADVPPDLTDDARALFTWAAANAEWVGSTWADAIRDRQVSALYLDDRVGGGKPVHTVGGVRVGKREAQHALTRIARALASRYGGGAKPARRNPAPKSGAYKGWPEAADHATAEAWFKEAKVPADLGHEAMTVFLYAAANDMGWIGQSWANAIRERNPGPLYMDARVGGIPIKRGSMRIGKREVTAALKAIQAELRRLRG